MMRFLISIILVFFSCHGTLEPEQETLPNISYNTYIYNNHWYPASPPVDSTQTINNRGKMIWYNPYEDELTKNIWPDSSTSTQENNNTTKTLHLETIFFGDSGDSSFWNGIMIPLFSSEHDQSQTEYLDLWLNAEGVQDDNFKLHIDIGHISEDWNNNQVLDTEDEPVYGPGMGDGILSDGEDIGVDNCTDSFEDGWGGCLCDAYDEAIYDSDLNGIYNHETEFCLSGVTYIDAFNINLDFVNLDLFDFDDPNGDNWCYNTVGCNSTSDYSRANGTEGNGQAMGYRYPDTEDLDNNYFLDTQNDYFSISILPKLPVDHPESMVVTETKEDGSPTGWKLIRIPLTGFSEFGDPAWNDVPTFRIRLESAEKVTQSLKIAAIEFGPIPEFNPGPDGCDEVVEYNWSWSPSDYNITSINDYNFIKDRYFFIDNNFKNSYYPLNQNNHHIYNSEYVIGEFELYRRATSAENPAMIQADAYLDPLNPYSYSVGGIWVRLEENIDYEIDRLLGYVRLKWVQNAIAVAYTTTSYNPVNQTFGANHHTSGTTVKSIYDDCVESSTDYWEECIITLKLLKDINSSTPNSPTWPLMFKNVYSLGGLNIEPSGLEVEIVRDLGGGDERTHSENGNSWLSIFGLDSEDANHQKVDGGDGKIDLYGSLLNLQYGELILPTYLPFAYDITPRIDAFGNPITEDSDSYWGINHSDLQGVLEVELNDADGDFSDDGDTGPAMYYSTNQDDINSQHEFLIKNSSSMQSSAFSLGFVVIEGSETIYLNNQLLQRGVDYYINYFAGIIHFYYPIFPMQLTINCLRAC